MAGIGKLTKLLIKGKKFLNSPAMKKVGAGAKATGKALIWPFKKVHKLQEYYKNPTTTGEKIKKGVFKTLEYTSVGLIGGSVIGMFGGLTTAIYGESKNDPDIQNKGATIFIKSIDTLAGCVAGLLLGGPIGAIAGAAYGLLSDKTLFTSIAKQFDEEGGQHDEDIINKTKKEMVNDVKELLGFSTAESPQQQEEQKKTGDNPEEKAKKEKGNENSAPVDSIPAAPPDSTRVVPPLSNDSTLVAPTDSTLVAQSDTTGIVSQNPTEVVNTQVVDKEEEKEEKDDQQPQTPPADNLFNGDIHEITKASVGIVKGDCLWNIAKRELQAANPGKTITNAQILKQVKEFGRLNPEMFGENPSLQKLDLIYPDKQLKLCA